jgi:hypothetical protein
MFTELEQAGSSKASPTSSQAVRLPSAPAKLLSQPSTQGSWLQMNNSLGKQVTKRHIKESCYNVESYCSSELIVAITENYRSCSFLLHELSCIYIVFTSG